MSSFKCPGCEYVYDEAKGEPREGFPAGTGWDQIPDEWGCPDCAVQEKIDFEVVAENRDEVVK
ncbi:MAG: rubredoxin [Mycobacterium sp.]